MYQKLPPEPQKPSYDDCCGGGACCPCVWDAYYDERAKWQDAKKQYDQKVNDLHLNEEV